jgi:ubiquitin-protein ligase E3 A
VRTILSAKIVIYFFNFFSFIEIQTLKDENILKNLIEINEEMNKKYNSYDHLSKLKCNDDIRIIELEKKFENFSIDPNYNYGESLLDEKQCLPKINIDLHKLDEFYKDKKYTVDDLTREIKIFNEYFSDLTQSVDLTKCETLREKCIVYYLYYFMNRCFFYVCMHNNFMSSKETSKIFQTFFNNFLLITNCSKLYLENDIENSSMIIEDENKMSSELFKKINNKLYYAFEDFKKFPDDFKNFLPHCHNFLSLLLFSVDQFTIIDDKEVPHIDEDIYSLFQTFIRSFSVIHDMNEYYSILNKELFFNDGISRDLNLRRDFDMFLKNEKIKKRQKKEGEKNQTGKLNIDKKIEEEKEKNKIEIDDDLNSEEEEEKEKEKEKDKEDDIANEKDKNKDKLEFTLFDYMWLFNTAAKSEIIKLFNSRKQKAQIIKSIQRRGNPDSHLNFLDIFFNSSKFSLQLNIRRDHLIEDALNELEKNRQNLQNELKVKFVGEQGVDQGGVRKEFFILVIRQIFDPNYGMFSYNKKTRLFWFNHFSFEPKIKYELIGTIFGLAIYNNTILDVKLPISIYKKLLGIKPTFEDLKECDNELYNNLNFIMKQDNPKLEEELDSYFTVIDDKFGEKIEVPLKPDGDKIRINNFNKEEYVELYTDWYFNKSIDEYFRSFEKGFYKVFNKSLTKILTPNELELILCGTQILDFHELKIAAVYEEFDKNSETIKYFWEILLDFDEEEKKKFLSFVTGCDRAPIDGLGSLSITITNGGNDINQLPTAHTCFNNLILPDYKDKEKMKKNLLIAINYSEGFGLI